MFFKIAKGCKNWLIFSFSLSIIFTIFTTLSFFQYKVILQNTFILFTFFLWLVSFFLLFFFRDPERDIGEGFTAPADGKITSIEQIKKDPVVGSCIRISIFMNIYNVHINRMPVDGEILDIKHIKGSYSPAFSKESEKNERIIFKIKTEFGVIKLVQIAGLIARRIVPYVKKHDKVLKGEKIGIIRLGSRVDVYLPKNFVKEIYLKKNDKTRAGVTKIAEIND